MFIFRLGIVLLDHRPYLDVDLHFVIKHALLRSHFSAERSVIQVIRRKVDALRGFAERTSGRPMVDPDQVLLSANVCR
jgi:hypothetical protein